MLTRLIKIQLVVLAAVAIIAVVVLGWYYLRIPSLVGVGRYTLYADLPTSGGLYRTANVTYRGITIGKVTAVDPTERGARAALSIDNRYPIPADASANVHSVSAVGEQYLDLVSTSNRGPYFENGQTITNSKVPSQIGPALDAANRALEALPKDKIAILLSETSGAVGGLGPSLRRLVDATQALAHGFKGNINDINAIIERSAPIIDSQVNSGNTIQRWAANLNSWPHKRRVTTKRCAAFCPTWHQRLIKCTRHSATYVTRCRRRWPTSRWCSTCSSATTRGSSRRWCFCRNPARSPSRLPRHIPVRRHWMLLWQSINLRHA